MTPAERSEMRDLFNDAMQTHVTYIRDDIRRVEGKVDCLETKVVTMQNNGCVVGEANSKRLDKIEAKPTWQGSAAGAATGGGIVGVMMLLKTLFPKLFGDM